MEPKARASVFTRSPGFESLPFCLTENALNIMGPVQAQPESVLCTKLNEKIRLRPAPLDIFPAPLNVPKARPGIFVPAHYLIPVQQYVEFLKKIKNGQIKATVSQEKSDISSSDRTLTLLTEPTPNKDYSDSQISFESTSCSTCSITTKERNVGVWKWGECEICQKYGQMTHKCPLISCRHKTGGRNSRNSDRHENYIETRSSNGREGPSLLRQKVNAGSGRRYSAHPIKEGRNISDDEGTTAEDSPSRPQKFDEVTYNNALLRKQPRSHTESNKQKHRPVQSWSDSPQIIKENGYKDFSKRRNLKPDGIDDCKHQDYRQSDLSSEEIDYHGRRHYIEHTRLAKRKGSPEGSNIKDDSSARKSSYQDGKEFYFDQFELKPARKKDAKYKGKMMTIENEDISSPDEANSRRVSNSVEQNETKSKLIYRKREKLVHKELCLPKHWADEKRSSIIQKVSGKEKKYIESEESSQGSSEDSSHSSESNEKSDSVDYRISRKNKYKLRNDENYGKGMNKQALIAFQDESKMLKNLSRATGEDVYNWIQKFSPATSIEHAMAHFDHDEAQRLICLLIDSRRMERTIEKQLLQLQGLEDILVDEAKKNEQRRIDSMKKNVDSCNKREKAFSEDALETKLNKLLGGTSFTDIQAPGKFKPIDESKSSGGKILTGAGKPGEKAVEKAVQKAFETHAFNFDMSAIKPFEMHVAKDLDMPVVKGLDIPVVKGLDMRVVKGVDMPVVKRLGMPVVKNLDMPVVKGLAMPAVKGLDMRVAKSLDIVVSRGLGMPVAKGLDMPVTKTLDMPVEKAISGAIEKNSLNLPLPPSQDKGSERIIEYASALPETPKKKNAPTNPSKVILVPAEKAINILTKTDDTSSDSKSAKSKNNEIKKMESKNNEVITIENKNILLQVNSPRDISTASQVVEKGAVKTQPKVPKESLKLPSSPKLSPTPKVPSSPKLSSPKLPSSPNIAKESPKVPLSPKSVIQTPLSKLPSSPKSVIKAPSSKVDSKPSALFKDHNVPKNFIADMKLNVKGVATKEKSKIKANGKNEKNSKTSETLTKDPKKESTQPNNLLEKRKGIIPTDQKNGAPKPILILKKAPPKPRAAKQLPKRAPLAVKKPASFKTKP